MGILEIEGRDIRSLTAEQLTMLLKRLLHLEAEDNGIGRSAVSVSFEINVPDGGKDGQIKWEDGPKPQDFIPSRFTLFQCKATYIGPGDCRKEVQTKNGELKPKVREVLDAGGAYVIFGSRKCQSTDKSEEGIRDGLRACGRADADTVDVRVYDVERIVDWTNKFPPAIVWVMGCSERSVPAGAKSWDQWQTYEENKYEYACNETLYKHMEALRRAVAEERAVVRVIGRSGLGKTRLALEAFRPPKNKGDIKKETLSCGVMYVCGDVAEGEVIDFATDVCNGRKTGILVVDDCNPTLHRKLTKEARRTSSRVRLVTMDFELEEPQAPTKTIRVREEDCTGVVPEILKQAYPGLSEAIIGRIDEFSQHFPKIAVILAEGVKQGIENVGYLSDRDIVKKLLWGRGAEDKDKILIMQACSLFKAFKLLDNDSDLTEQAKFVGEEIAEVGSSRFYAVCQEYGKRDILQTHGRYWGISPLPLAITLAADWWDQVVPARAKQIIQRVSEVGLVERFCEQMANLQFSPRAKELTKDLCGAKGPFGNAEVLNSEGGSRLFQALVKVNPQATCEAADRVFGTWTREQLLEVGPGRRNLIWALESLCWWQETFAKAARLMLAFAAAENESWGNNATGQFLQLFHVRLPGTQADLGERMLVIKDALNSDVSEKHELAIKALSSALHTDGFSRGGPVAEQGSRVPGKDYEPNGPEIYEYWKECVDLLREVICGGGELSGLARAEFAKHIRGLMSCGMLDEIEAAVEDICSNTGAAWPEALDAVRRSLEFEGKEMPGDVRERIEGLEQLLLPTDLENRLRLTVDIPDWRHTKNDSGEYEDISAEAAQELASELGPTGDAWYDKMAIVFEGDQRQGYAFGHRLGEVTKMPEKFIERALECLRALPEERANAMVLGAFLSGMPERALVTATIEKMSSDEKLLRHIARVTNLAGAEEDDLERLLSLVEKNKIEVEDLVIFSFGRALDHLPMEFVARFCERVGGVGLRGTWCALHILFMYCYKKEERIVGCRASFRKLLMADGLLGDAKSQGMEMHYWGITAKRLVEGEKDVKLAHHLAKEMVDVCKSDKVLLGNKKNDMKGVLGVLFAEYLEQSWPVIGRGLLSKNWRLVDNLKHLLGVGYDKEEGECVLTEVPEEVLIAWCAKNKPKGPKIVSNIIPIFGQGESSEEWHPLTKKMIDNFGSIEEVRRALTSNLVSFVSSGSRVPYYRRRLGLVEKLLCHKSKEVRLWAEQVRKGLEHDINESSIRDEEWRFGII